MTQTEPQGLGGWLVLVGLGLSLAPIRMGFQFANDLLPIMTEGYWPILTDPASAAYHPLWAPLIVFEVVGNLAFIIASAYLLVLFFQRSPRFPRLMIWYLLTNLAFLAIDSLVAKAIPEVAAQADPQGARELLRGFVGCLIWVPYLMSSRRVRNTFRTPPTEPAPVPESTAA